MLRTRSDPRGPSSAIGRAARALSLTIAGLLAACGTDAVAAPGSPDASASASAAASPSPRTATATPKASSGPHQSIVTVLEVVQLQGTEADRMVFAMRLRGEVGTSAVIRTLEIQARMVPVDGSACPIPPLPTVLRPTHADAVQPALADETRVVVVRSLGDGPAAVGAGSFATFGYGPVPSLNGDFDGWVSFHFPREVAGGSCAFDVGGAVIVVAGETTSVELPTVRVDTRGSP